MDRVTLSTWDWVIVTGSAYDVAYDLLRHKWNALATPFVVLALMYRIGRLQKERS